MISHEKLTEFQQSQLKSLHDLTVKYVSSVQMLTELNLQHAKESLDAQANHQQELMDIKSWEDWLALQHRAFQPITDKVAAYTQNLYDIFWGFSHEVSHALNSSSIQEAAKPATTDNKIKTEVALLIKSTPQATPSPAKTKAGESRQKKQG